MRDCHHVIGMVLMQVARDRGGFADLVNIDELRLIRVYGGLVFNFCRNSGRRIEVER